MAVRQEVNNLEYSVVVHELEFATKRVLYGLNIMTVNRKEGNDQESILLT